MVRKWVKYTAVATILGVVATICISATKGDFQLGRNMEIFVNLMRVLYTQYVDEVDANTMLKSGAKGVTSALDPYTEFIPEEDLPDLERMTTGRYGGIGSLIRKRGDYVTIAEPYRNSPADKAGFMAGDKIVAIEGESMKGANVEDVSKRLRGEANTVVKITIERLLDSTRHEHTIRRQRITIPSISYVGYVSEGVGYIRHEDFTDKCYDDMRAAILKLQSEGELKSLILDYRNNGGGVLQSAIQIVSLFVPKGTVVVETKGRTQATKTYRTENEPLLPNTPLAVLINRNSASAAEIVAGAIQDLDRGVLFGEKSFGKGLVQGTAALGYNAHLKYTVGKYYIPSGRCVQAVQYGEGGRAKPIADSLINEFKTSRGRKVYDGGGIMPDIKVAPRAMSDFAAVLYLVGAVDDFCDDYTRRNGVITADKMTFSINDRDYEAFSALVEGRELPYKSDSRRALEDLTKALSDEEKAALGEQLASLDKGIKDDKKSLLAANKQELTQLINADLVRRAYYADGSIAHSLPTDKCVGEAVKILGNKAEYERILSSQDTQRK